MKEFATLDKAMELAQQGYSVYPLIKNTKTPPKGHHGYLEATRDQNTIMDWFQSNPDYNLGLRLDTSRLLVVDVDMHDPTKNGKDSLMKLQRQGKSLSPDTYIEKTASGGLHYFFKYTGDKVRQVDNWPGIDLLGDFTVIAPSEINGKPYEPLDGRTLADVKPVPNWLVDMMKPDEKPDFSFKVVRPSKYKSKMVGNLVAMLNQTIGQGGRNDYLTRICGLLLSSTATGGEVLKTLLKINSINCVPSLPEREVIGIYKSILKHELRKKVVNR